MEHLLGNILVVVTIPFVVVTLFFGTKGGYYDTCLLYTSDAADE